MILFVVFSTNIFFIIIYLIKNRFQEIPHNREQVVFYFYLLIH
jgi:hypothetical protein